MNKCLYYGHFKNNKQTVFSSITWKIFLTCNTIQDLTSYFLCNDKLNPNYAYLNTIIEVYKEVEYLMNSKDYYENSQSK